LGVEPLKRALIVLACVVAFLAAAAAAPILWIETSCRAATTAAPPVSAFGLPDAGYRRAEGDSYLTFPEWYIVYAYDDVAAVTRQSSESAFDYVGSVRGFWASLCGATKAAGKVGPASSDQRVTDYIIGVSFSAEMAVIGAWERTIGALTVFARGPQRTPEDEFALRVADDYAAFLRQTPWYRYPFWPTLGRFWAETPFRQTSLIRSAERRVALSLEYAGKGLYAKAIGWLAGYSPADLTIRSVVGGLNDEDFARDPRLHRIADLGAGATLIETPRYQEFTEILIALARRGQRVLEIAGNHHILATALTPAGVSVAAPGALLFSLPMQGRPGWRRVGLDVDVAALADRIVEVERKGAEFEHAYDY
jgi:hypothetical protein